MANQMIHAVTGAFGYSGKYIAQRLLDSGERVITLTNSATRANPFGKRITPYPFQFDNLEALARTLQGVSVLYNTYWVRFNHANFTHADAVRNTQILFAAAKQAGVERIVHVSITNPSTDSPLEYFHGKAMLEESLMDSGISYAILRPTVLFGKEDILINNIAWALRRFPLFGLFGGGSYRLQPIYVDDLAAVAVAQGLRQEDTIINAIGPETFSYRELVTAIGEIIEHPRPLLNLPPSIAYLASLAIGRVVNDVFVTREEIEGLMAGLLYVDAPPAGQTKLTDWARRHASTLGVAYANELTRRRDRAIDYG